ncbi:MAG TPA: stage III sporulation protein AG [Pseudobacteroides sp.]|uniref:stage III sporulation protein AG n=1 Tax=Pseudobacteroides sp. TaxID=1968840 RepID=UPI002F9255FF
MIGIKELLEKLFQNKNKKKIIENSVIVIIIGIIAIVAGGSLFKKSETKKESLNETTIKTQAASAKVEPSENDFNEKKLEELLMKVKGAGKVHVMVTYVSGKEIVPAYDKKRNESDTQEKDSGGGVRSIKQNDNEDKLAYEESQGNSKKPIVLKELLPEVKGVVVIADGASDPEVKERLVRAVQVLLDVPVHRVEVLESGAGYAK